MNATLRSLQLLLVLSLLAAAATSLVWLVVQLGLLTVGTAFFFLFRNRRLPTPLQDKFFSNFQVGGHRGASLKAPENTIEAFRQAKEDGAALVEFDLQLTSDGVVVLFHDDTLERTTDGTGHLTTKTLAVLQKLVMTTKTKGGLEVHPTARIPTLAEAVEFCVNNEIKMIFDVKCYDKKMNQEIVEIFDKFKIYDRAAVCSFVPLVAFFIKRANPLIPTGYTTRRWAYSMLKEESRPRHGRPLNWIYQALDVLNSTLTLSGLLPAFLGVDMLLVNEWDIDRHLVEWARRRGHRVVAWTVNDRSAMRHWRHLKTPLLTDAPHIFPHKTPNKE